MKHLIPYLLILTIACITSCRKKIEFPQWEVSVVFPVAYTSLKITDLVKDSILKTNSDQSLSVVYSGDIYKIDFDTLFKIPDTTIFQAFKCTICSPNGTPLTFYAGAPIIDATANTKYNLNSVELTEVRILSGSIEVELRSTFSGKTLLTYQMPLTKDPSGNTFSVTDTLPAASPGNPTVISRSYNLAGYKIDLKGLNGNNFNTMVSKFNATTLEQTNVSITDSVRILNTFKNIVPEYAKGYFGNTVINSEAINTAINKLPNLISGNFDLQYFNLTLKVQNEVGVDIRFLLSEIVSKNISSGNNVSLTGSVVGSAMNINRASVNPSLPYPSIVNSEYVVNMNTSNSNADELLEIFPDSISASSQITLNPLLNISNSNDFVYYGHGINISVDTEIPLCFSANNLTLADTLSISFQPDSVANQIVGGNLILNCYNGYPFAAKPELFLMNENYSVFETLVADGQLIEPADMDANYKSVGKKFSRIFIPVNQERIEKLKTAKNLLLKLSFSTAAQPAYVKIYSNYSIDLKLVADIDYKIEN